MQAPAVVIVVYDNSNVNYTASDGFNGNMSDLNLLINSNECVFDPLKYGLYKRVLKGHLTSLHNLDRLMDGTEQPPVQVSGETNPHFQTRENIYAQRRRIAKEIVLTGLRKYMIKTGDET